MQDQDELLLSDPNLTPGELADIAARRPDLHAQVALSPVAYPELLEWLGTSEDPDVQQAVQQAMAAEPQEPQALSAPSLRPTSLKQASSQPEPQELSEQSVPPPPPEPEELPELPEPPEPPEPPTALVPPEPEELPEPPEPPGPTGPPEPPAALAPPAPPEPVAQPVATEGAVPPPTAPSEAKKGKRWWIPALLVGVAVIVAAVAVWLWMGTRDQDDAPVAEQSETETVEAPEPAQEQSVEEDAETDPDAEAEEDLEDELPAGPQEMNTDQIALGNFGSVQGTWKNDAGDTVTIVRNTIEFSRWPDFTVKGAVPQEPCDGTWDINTKLSPGSAAFIWICLGPDGERQSVRSIFFLPDFSGSEALVVRDSAGADSETFWSLDQEQLQPSDTYRRD